MFKFVTAVLLVVFGCVAEASAQYSTPVFSAENYSLVKKFHDSGTYSGQATTVITTLLVNQSDTLSWNSCKHNAWYANFESYWNDVYSGSTAMPTESSFSVQSVHTSANNRSCDDYGVTLDIRQTAMSQWQTLVDFIDFNHVVSTTPLIYEAFLDTDKSRIDSTAVFQGQPCHFYWQARTCADNPGDSYTVRVAMLPINSEGEQQETGMESEYVELCFMSIDDSNDEQGWKHCYAPTVSTGLQYCSPSQQLTLRVRIMRNDGCEDIVEFEDDYVIEVQ